MSSNSADNPKTLVGWREWLAMDDLGVDRILAKVDTGAKTCALHTFYITPFERDNEAWLTFGLHPDRDSSERELHCQAPIKERRDVTDSGGHTENRYVIETNISLAGKTFPVEVTLTNRDNMRYRLLLGRNALRRGFIVESSKSYLLGR